MADYGWEDKGSKGGGVGRPSGGLIRLAKGVGNLNYIWHNLITDNPQPQPCQRSVYSAS
jgi:hypothetical protein